MQHQIYFYHFGWRDLTTPTIELMLSIMHVLWSHIIEKHEKVAVHCHAGEGMNEDTEPSPSPSCCSCSFVLSVHSPFSSLCSCLDSFSSLLFSPPSCSCRKDGSCCWFMACSWHGNDSTGGMEEKEEGREDESHHLCSFFSCIGLSSLFSSSLCVRQFSMCDHVGAHPHATKA